MLQALASTAEQMSLRCALSRITILILSTHSHDEAANIANRILAIDPLHEQAHRALMQIYAVQGRTLNPLDPQAYLTWHGIAFAHFSAARYGDAAAWVNRSLRSQPNYLPAMRLKIAVSALQNHASECGKWTDRLLEIAPDTLAPEIAPPLPTECQER
jgi:hypothetical protein